MAPGVLEQLQGRIKRGSLGEGVWSQPGTTVSTDWANSTGNVGRQYAVTLCDSMPSVTTYVASAIQGFRG